MHLKVFLRKIKNEVTQCNMDLVKIKQKVFGLKGGAEDFCAEGETEAIGEKSDKC